MIDIVTWLAGILVGLGIGHGMLKYRSLRKRRAQHKRHDENIVLLSPEKSELLIKLAVQFVHLQKSQSQTQLSPESVDHVLSQMMSANTRLSVTADEFVVVCREEINRLQLTSN